MPQLFEVDSAVDRAAKPVGLHGTAPHVAGTVGCPNARCAGCRGR